MRYGFTLHFIDHLSQQTPRQGLHQKANNNKPARKKQQWGWEKDAERKAKELTAKRKRLLSVTHFLITLHTLTTDSRLKLSISSYSPPGNESLAALENILYTIFHRHTKIRYTEVKTICIGF